MNEAQIKSVALFFFYALMDERAAVIATVKTIEKCNRRIRKSPEVDIPSVVVHYSLKFWQKWQKNLAKTSLSVTYEAGWILPEGAELGAWQDYRRVADVDEFLALIWSKILKYSDAQVAQGLGVTVGTVRHRVSRGLRQLGSIRGGRHYDR